MVVPGHQLVDLDAARLAASLASISALAARNGSRVSSSSSSNSLMSSSPSCSLRYSCRAWKFLKPSLPGRLVAQLDQLLQVGLDDLADLLARFPDGLAALGVVRLLEDLADLAVGHLLAVDLGAEDVERLLDRVGLGDHLLEQVGIDLLFQVGQVEHVDGPGERPGRRCPCRASLSALSSAKASRSARASSILFWASSFL